LARNAPKTTNALEQKHFSIDQSTIRDAGKGLFAKVNISPGDTIGPYTGIVLSDKEVDREPYVDSDYVLWVCKDHNIVGEGPGASYVRFINHHDKPNCRFVVSTRWKKARVEAIKRIRPGEEIFVDYGPYYWEECQEHEAPGKPQ